MARPCSMDLRERVVRQLNKKACPRRQAADRFGIGIKAAIDWVRRHRETGSVAAKPMGGCRPKKIVGQHETGYLSVAGSGLYAAWPGRRAGRAWSAVDYRVVWSSFTVRS